MSSSRFQAVSSMSARTGCSRLVTNHLPRDTNTYGLNDGHSNLHIIPGWHKSKANTPSSNIILWDGSHYTFESDRGLTRHKHILSNVPQSLSRHSDDITIASPGASAIGPGGPGDDTGSVLTTLLTVSSEPVRCMETSPS